MEGHCALASGLSSAWQALLHEPVDGDDNGGREALEHTLKRSIIIGQRW